jgi:hypothetical protein
MAYKFIGVTAVITGPMMLQCGDAVIVKFRYIGEPLFLNRRAIPRQPFKILFS